MTTEQNAAQHTVGPWIADIHGHIMAKASALLIAAAPDMLDALKKCSRELEELRFQTNCLTSRQYDGEKERKSLEGRVICKQAEAAQAKEIADAVIAKAEGK